MNTKKCYIKPRTELIEIETQTAIMEASFGVSENETNGVARSKRRGFWGDEEE